MTSLNRHAALYQTPGQSCALPEPGRSRALPRQAQCGPACAPGKTDAELPRIQAAF